MQRYVISALAAALVLGYAAPAFAQSGAASPAPSPNAAEAKFVSGMRSDLEARFPTAADAVKAGYIRYTNEDSTGAISYANRQWTSSDAAHPSQLWYDAGGKLIGADYSVPYAADKRPALWGIDPSRWSRFGLHIHYGLAGPNGTTVFGGLNAKKYAAAGGDPQHPDAAGLVKAGVTKDPADVKFVFTFPAIWDLEVWVVPNPLGAFSDNNPNVKPSANAKAEM